MKKLNIALPNEPMPEEYNNISRPKMERQTNESEGRVLPPKLTPLDFDKLTVLKSKFKNAVASEKESELKDVLLQVMEYLGDDLEAHKKEVCLYVMWKIERFILKPKEGPLKRSICTKVLAPLFHNSEVDVGLYIDALMHEHKQIKTLGRMALRVFRYFTKND